MTLEFVDSNINNKISENEALIKYTFYELRIKENLTEDEMYSFLVLATTKLINIGYKVYTRGQKYSHDYKDSVVQSNELLIAIKRAK